MKPRRILSFAVAALLLGYIIVMLISLEDTQAGNTCKGLQVTVRDGSDKHFVSEEDLVMILKQVGLYPAGKPVKAVNTDKMETELLKNGMIAEVVAYKTPSDIIKIDVKQKTPVLRVMGAGGNFYVDSKGNIMPVSRRYTAHVPVANGYIEKRLATTDLYKFALFLQEDMFWNDQIEQIYVHPDGETELIPRVGAQRILLGTLEGFEEKLANLRLFYEQAIPKTGWEKYGRINLKYKNQVVCTKK